VYIERGIDLVLREWSSSSARKPLILRGARQTGKTESIRHLSDSFELFLELNLERYEDLALVRASNSAEDLLAALRARFNVASFPERTLLFLDEIQESPVAIQWLRFLREDHPDLAVIAAGSLLEVRLQERGFSFPVGRVTFQTLRPLSFVEFLSAAGHNVLVDQLVSAISELKPIPPPLHDQASKLLRTYIQVGGMPEAVVRWLESGRLASAQQVHTDLVQSLAEDLQKYRGARDVAHLEAAFENLRHHYGLRFKYEKFAPGYRSQQMKAALAKLEAALLITRAWPTSSLSAPPVARPRSAPKLIPLDTGLALSTMTFDVSELKRWPLDKILGGRLAEMFVGQELLTGTGQTRKELCFWVSESSRSSAEVDFLLSTRGRLIPLETKSAASGSLKSLHQFLWRSGVREAVRLHSGSFTDERHQVKMPDGVLHYRLLSLPLYLASLVLEIFPSPEH
jgi:predicted AAA+ superfamily ATPase